MGPLDFDYVYLFYEDDGPLHTGLHLQPVAFMFRPDKALQGSEQEEKVVNNSFGLLRFLQLWLYMADNYQAKDPLLIELESILQGPLDDERLQSELLFKAHNIINQCVESVSLAPHGYLSVLAKRDLEIMARLLRLGGLRDDLDAILRQVEDMSCDELSDKILLVGTFSSSSRKKHDLFLNISSSNVIDDVVTFKLVAVIDAEGKLTTIDVRCDEQGNML